MVTAKLFIAFFMAILMQQEACCKPTDERVPLTADDFQECQLSDKFFYMSANSAYYEAGRDDCKNIFNGTLAVIDKAEDVIAIRDKFDIGATTAVWVGGVLKSTCPGPQMFHKNCWKWVDGQEIKVIDVEGDQFDWDSKANSHFQTAMSRVYYSPKTKYFLNVDYNTAAYRFLCQVKIVLPPPPCV